MAIASQVLAVTAACLAGGGSDFRVFVAPGENGEFRGAAEILAASHDAESEEFDPSDFDALLERLRAAPPAAVVFVVPPETIDVDFAHRVLEVCVGVDDDPFADFEYGFVTGRDGKAAERFVANGVRARRAARGAKTTMFGSWGGTKVPVATKNTAARALGLDLHQSFVPLSLPDDKRRAHAREALLGAADDDFLLFFSHGYPDSMEGCFRAADLRDWGVRFDGAVLVSCACFNGCPGKWYAPLDGSFEHPAPARDASIALALLDTGVAAFVGGVDAWHGPLAMQAFALITGDGLSLGAAQKRMQDRLALAFLPERVRYPAAREHTARFSGEGRDNRLGNGGGMIVYGDPTFVPRAVAPPATGTTRVARESDRMVITIEQPALVDGGIGDDAMIAQSRLTDYYSVRSADFVAELAGECHRAIPWEPGTKPPERLAVRAAKLGDGSALATGTPQVVRETTPRGTILHVRVPIDVKLATGFSWMAPCAKGFSIELAEP